MGGSTGWRESRAMKLGHQFKSDGTGGKRTSGKVGAGSEDWDGKANALIPEEVKTRTARQSVRDMLVEKPACMFCCPSPIPCLLLLKISYSGLLMFVTFLLSTHKG